MEIIPLIYIRERRLLDEKKGKALSLDDLFKQVEKDSMIYVIDLDGTTKDDPDLDLYQQLSEQYTLWIDNGPRDLDDVMDTIMAGATNITLRKDLWPNADIAGIREITEDEIYFTIELGQKEQNFDLRFFSEDSGAVIFGDEQQIDESFKSNPFFKELISKHKLYLYTVPPMHVSYWNEQGVSGILVDVNKKEGYR